jgi:hypothetical protein
MYRAQKPLLSFQYGEASNVYKLAIAQFSDPSMCKTSLVQIPNFVTEFNRLHTIFSHNL